MYIHVDGNGFSGRLDELLTLGGTILKQDSPYEAFYYSLLRRGVDYVPLRRDLTDLCAQLQALKADAAMGKRIAASAANFTEAYLSLDGVLGFVAALLRRYAEIQRFQPVPARMALRWRNENPKIAVAKK